MFRISAAALIALSILCASCPADAARKKTGYVKAKTAPVVKHKLSKSAEYYHEGCSFEKLGLIDKAEESYRLSVKEDPKFAAGLFRLAWIYDLKKDYKKAAETYKKVIETDKSFFPAYNNLGIDEYNLGNYSAASSYWRESLKINPSQHEVYNNLGLAAAASGNYDQAVSFYDKALQLKPLFSGAAKNRAYALVKTGDYAAADAQLAKNSRIFSSDPMSFYNYASFCINWHNYKKASKQLEAGLKLNNTIQSFYNLSALASASFNDDAAADLQLENALAHGGETAAYLKTAGRVAHLQDNNDKALAFYLKSMKKNDEDPELFTWLGELYADMKMDTQALNSWEMAVAKNSDFLKARNSRALYYLSRNNWQQAVIDNEAVLRANPHDFEALYIKGAIEEAKGNSAGAIEFYGKAIDGCPYFEEPAEALALLYSAKGEYKKASEIVSDAIERNPSQPGLYCVLGKVYLDMGNSEGAVKTWMEGLALDGSHALIYYYLGVVSQNAGDADSASGYFSSYLKLAPDGKYSQDAKNRIMKLSH